VRCVSESAIGPVPVALLSSEMTTGSVPVRILHNTGKTLSVEITEMMLLSRDTIVPRRCIS
jgi:hypothetical protein